MHWEDLLTILSELENLSENEFVDMLLEPEDDISIVEDSLADDIEDCLKKYNNKKRKLLIADLVNSLKSENEQSLWNILVKLAHRMPKDPMLRNLFVLPALRGEIQDPKTEKKSKGRPSRDESEKFRITLAVSVLQRSGHKLSEAYSIVGKKIFKESDTVRKIYKEMKEKEPQSLKENLDGKAALKFLKGYEAHQKKYYIEPKKE